MIAIQVIQPPAPAQPVVEPEFDPGIGQSAPQARGKRQAAVSVKQTTHPHFAPGRLFQGLHNGFGTVAGLNQIQLQIDMFLRLVDSRQHAREKLRPVNQQLELIGAAPWKHCAGHISGP